MGSRKERPTPSIVITGASSGIGRDAALFLVGRGYRVFAGVRRQDDGRRLADDARHGGGPGTLTPVLLEVTDDDQVAAAVDVVAGEVGDAGLDALFSNAGIASFNGDTACETCPITTQQRIMEVNHFGAVRVIQHFLPLVRAARGRVVINSALMARIPLPFNGGYAASKAALEAWATTLRREVAPHDVQVVLIEAAAIASSLTEGQSLDDVPSDGPYGVQRAFLEHSAEEMRERAGDPKVSPRRFSEAVARAIEADHPHRRYVVGGGSRILDAVAHLPEMAQDELIEHAVAHMAASTGVRR